MLDISMPQSWNAYAYVNNQPTRITDPTGRCGTWKFWQCVANGHRYGKWESNDDTADQFRAEFKQNLAGLRTTDGEYIDLSDIDWSKESNDSVFLVADTLSNLTHSQLDGSNVTVEGTREGQIELPDVDPIIIGNGSGGSEPWRSTSASRPLKKMGHAQKHLPEFKKLDPTLTDNDVAKILEFVRKTATPTAAEHGAKAFEAAVQIGGKSVTVKVIESAGGVIKTGFPIP